MMYMDGYTINNTKYFENQTATPIPSKTLHRLIYIQNTETEGQ